MTYPRVREQGVSMTDLVKMNDYGQCLEVFAFGVGRIDNLGAVTRISFFSPNRTDLGAANEKVLHLIVPTDQLAKIAAALVQPLGPPLSAGDMASDVTLQ